MRLLSEVDVDWLFEVGPAIDATERGFCAMQRGEAQVPLRTEIYRSDPPGRALIMSALIGDHTLGMKLVSHLYTRETPPQRLATGLMVIWDAMTLEPRGVIAANAFNDHRTAAGLAVATRALARANSRTYTVYGAGKISFQAVRYVASVRPIERIILSSRTQSRAVALADLIRRTPELAHIDVETGLSADDAAAEADIITTVTTTELPVFDGKRVRAGTHINLAGANRKDRREMDDYAARRSVFFSDTNDGVLARAGDVVIPMATGAITIDNIRAEVGAVLTGDAPGRKTEDEITVFKSLGVAVQDMVLGAYLVDRAEAIGVGAEFDHLNGGIKPAAENRESAVARLATRQAFLPQRPPAPSGQ